MPQCLNISVVISDIWVIHVYPVAHLICKRLPFFCILHHLPAAGRIVLLNSYTLSDILFCYTQTLLNTQLNRESVSIPSRLSLNLKTTLGFESAENILYCPGHYMVNTGHPVC